MADVANTESVKELAAETVVETNDASKVEESTEEKCIEEQLDAMVKEVAMEKPKVVEKLEVLENKIIKAANSDVETALKQLQTLPPPVKVGRPKKNVPVSDNGKESTPMFTSRTLGRRTFLTSDELDKELEATMEKIEPGSSIQITNNGNQTRAIQDQDLIAILEGNADAVIIDRQPAEVELELEAAVTEESVVECEAEIALQQMMSMPKVRAGRKAKHVTTKQNSSNEVSDRNRLFGYYRLID